MRRIPESDLLDVLIRLERVATGLEAEGYFGASKLCRALSRSMLTRTAHNQGIPRASATLDQEFGALIDDLRGFDVDSRVLSALQVGQEAARKNTTTSWDEIPAVHVCRICGELFLGQAPEFCPTCGSHVLTYWEVPPVFYLEPLSPRQVLDALESMPETLSELIEGMSEAQLTRSPADGEWSIRDVLWHLLMAEGVLSARAKLILAEENPSLEAQAVWTFANDPTVTTQDVLRKFDQSRRETLKMLGSIRLDDWLRSGRHTEFGQVTLLQQASYFAKHERYHLPQIASVKNAVTEEK